MDGPSYVTFVFHVPVFGAVLELLQDFVCVPYDARSCAQLLQHLADQTGLQPSHLATASLWYRTTPTMVPIECTDKTVVDLASGALQGARLEVIVECGGDCMAHVDWQLRAEVMAAQMRASGTVVSGSGAAATDVRARACRAPAHPQPHPWLTRGTPVAPPCVAHSPLPSS